MASLVFELGNSVAFSWRRARLQRSGVLIEGERQRGRSEQLAGSSRFAGINGIEDGQLTEQKAQADEDAGEEWSCFGLRSVEDTCMEELRSVGLLGQQIGEDASLVDRTCSNCWTGEEAEISVVLQHLWGREMESIRWTSSRQWAWVNERLRRLTTEDTWTRMVARERDGGSVDGQLQMKNNKKEK